MKILNTRMLTVIAMSLMGFTGAAMGADFNENKLGIGSVRIYSMGDYKLHSYSTNDAMADECFLLESKTKLIAIEGPAFTANYSEWNNYIAGLKKPLDAVLLPYHPNGGKWYGNTKSYKTQTANDAQHSGSTKALVNNLGQAFGKDFSTEIAPADVIIKAGKNTIAGIELIINDDADGFTMEIPAINAIYVHMMGADSHSILANTAHMDAYIKTLEGYKKQGFKLVLSSHHKPEQAAAIDTKIAYVKKAKELAAKSKSADEFISSMKAAFPSYQGLNYLEMSAGMIYK